jgi:hypothetical protein
MARQFSYTAVFSIGTRRASHASTRVASTSSRSPSGVPGPACIPACIRVSISAKTAR